MKIKRPPRHLKYKKSELNDTKKLKNLKRALNHQGNINLTENSELYLQGTNTNDDFFKGNLKSKRIGSKKKGNFRLNSRSTKQIYHGKNPVDNLGKFMKTSSSNQINDSSNATKRAFKKEELKCDPDFILNSLCNKKVLDRIVKRERLQENLLLTSIREEPSLIPRDNPRALPSIVPNPLAKLKRRFASADTHVKKKDNNMNQVTSFKLSEIEFNRGLKNYHYMNEVFKKNESHFKVSNKIEEINYKQLMEIKLYAQNMIYKKLFEEFTKDIKRQKKHAQMINIVKNNEIRAMRLKRKNISELKKVTKFVSDKINNQRLKVNELIEEFKHKFDMTETEKDQIMESFNPTF